MPVSGVGKPFVNPFRVGWLLWRAESRFSPGTTQSARLQSAGPLMSRGRIHDRIRRILYIVLFLAMAQVVLSPSPSEASAYQFLRLMTPGSLFAIAPDLNIRRIDPSAPSNLWTLGEGWGIPPLFYYTKVPGLYDRVDFLYPFGFREESALWSKLKFQPFFESRWSKIPPFDGSSRCLTLYHGRSDLGQTYWGFFPFYGYSYRRWGVDKNFFFLFPLYYESTDDDARSIRFLWPIGTYANSPGRSSFKIWPILGRDAIRNDYFNRFVLWPFFQWIDKYPGTDQTYSYRALPFPLYVTENDAYSCTTHILWPFVSYYHHYRSGHTRYSLRPLITYGSGGGIDELSLLFLYSYKKDWRKATTTKDSQGYISVQGEDVVTEQSFLMMSKVHKHYRKGSLVAARYLFWPFADYSWSLAKGSHLKVPCLIPMKSDFWDLNLGWLFRFVDFRDTPITRELSLLFGLSRRTEIKSQPHIPPPPKPGDDGWAELITGAFGKR